MDENPSAIDDVLHDGLAETVGPGDVAESSLLPSFGGSKMRLLVAPRLSTFRQWKWMCGGHRGTPAWFFSRIYCRERERVSIPVWHRQLPERSFPVDSSEELRWWIARWGPVWLWQCLPLRCSLSVRYIGHHAKLCQTPFQLKAIKFQRGSVDDVGVFQWSFNSWTSVPLYSDLLWCPLQSSFSIGVNDAKQHLADVADQACGTIVMTLSVILC